MISPQDEKTLRKLLSLATEPEEALTYDALRGFLFGVAITPDVVMPREWLPMVFGEKMITAPGEKEVKLYFETLARIVNNFIERFNENVLSFPFDMEDLSEETTLDVIQDWAYGLNEALTLRADCWYEFMPESVQEEQVEEYDDELLTALSVIHGLARPDEADELFTTQFEGDEDRSERLLASLFVMLPTAVAALLDHAAALDLERREALRREPEDSPPAPKVGRNDPCPCGSGKKYKKCCMGKVNIVPF